MDETTTNHGLPNREAGRRPVDFRKKGSFIRTYIKQGDGGPRFLRGLPLRWMPLFPKIDRSASAFANSTNHNLPNREAGRRPVDFRKKGYLSGSSPSRMKVASSSCMECTPDRCHFFRPFDRSASAALVDSTNHGKSPPSPSAKTLPFEGANKLIGAVRRHLDALQQRVHLLLAEIDRRYEAEGVSIKMRRCILLAVSMYIAFSPGLINIILLYMAGWYIPFTPTAEGLAAYLGGFYLFKGVRFLRRSLRRFLPVQPIKV